jgi:hypothetical protein
MNWGIGWQSVLAPHKHNTSVHLVMGFEQLESSEHSVASSRGLEIVGVLNHMMLWSGISLSSYLRLWLK